MGKYYEQLSLSERVYIQAQFQGRRHCHRLETEPVDG
jgi:hypothetical protein